MAKGSLKLNLKRDDARTLMLKMDARLTYAGRERNASFRLEGERELKHIEVTHQLINAELNRAKMDIQRRFDFYQMLKEQNRERRQKRDLAWCEEEERDWDRQARAARRRRTLPKLQVHKNHKAEAVGSIRRDVKGEFANKMSHEMHLNRSLLSLSDSYNKHETLTRKNEAKLAQITEHDDQGEALQTEESQNTLLSSKLKDYPCGPKISKPKHGILAHKTTLPELPVGKVQMSSLPIGISSNPHGGKIGELLGNARPKGRPTIDRHQPVYLNTSTNLQQQAGALQTDLPAVPNTKHTRRKGVYKLDRADAAEHGWPSTHRLVKKLQALDHKETKKHRISLTLGPQQMLPLRFYETEENPFLKGDVPTTIDRSRDLIDADKAEEMYEWLGFESRGELERLREAGLVLECEREACSETSSISEEDA